MQKKLKKPFRWQQTRRSRELVPLLRENTPPEPKNTKFPCPFLGSWCPGGKKGKKIKK